MLIGIFLRYAFAYFVSPECFLGMCMLERKKTARKRGSDEKKGCVTPPTRKGMKFPEGKKSINILIIPLLLVTDERGRKRKLEKREEDKEEEDFFLR